MKTKRNDVVGGILLVGFGLMALLGQFVDFSDTLGMMILPVIAAVFLIAGIFTRNAGFIIPGGIIGGIALGTLLITGPFSQVGGDVEGGIFMLSFAAGWALITVLTAVFTQKPQWWPLIPGGIMAVIGTGILFGGVFMTVLAFVGKIWPVFLILGGVALLWQSRDINEKSLEM